MRLLNKINLDICKGNEKPMFFVKQNDSGRELEIEFYQNGEILTIPDGDNITLHVRRPDDSKFSSSGEHSYNKFMTSLTSEMLELPGALTCEVVVVDGEEPETRITFPTFTIIVNPTNVERQTP